MSFDDLFGLLLFVVFIALPALSRMAGKKRGGGASPTAGAPNPGAPATGRTTTASTRPTASAGDGGTTAVPANDELERRLAEARERVRRALEGQGQGQAQGQGRGQAQAPGQGPGQGQRRPGTAPSSGSAPAPAARTSAAAPRPSAQRPRGKFVSVDRDDGLLSTPLDPATAGFLGPKRGPATERATRLAEAPALQVERPGARSGGRGGSRSGAFATDPDTIRDALIWHQVLGEPRARRPLGGRPSTLRSR